MNAASGAFGWGAKPLDPGLPIRRPGVGATGGWPSSTRAGTDDLEVWGDSYENNFDEVAMKGVEGWLLTTPVLLATLQKHEGKAIRMLEDGYFTLWTLGRLAAGQSGKLASEGRVALAVAVERLGETAREEAEEALRRGWVEALDETGWGPTPPWELFSADKVVGKIAGEVHAICLGLTFSIEMVPEDWQALLCRSSSHLLAALADVIEEMAKKSS